MRTKQIIPGLNNNQRFRVIINGIGFYTTVKQMTEMPFTEQRVAVWNAMVHCASGRISGFGYQSKVYDHQMKQLSFDVQVDKM